jgi:hypothetical protein
VERLELERAEDCINVGAERRSLEFIAAVDHRVDGKDRGSIVPVLGGCPPS